jgi:hypothetical protein
MPRWSKSTPTLCARSGAPSRSREQGRGFRGLPSLPREQALPATKPPRGTAIPGGFFTHVWRPTRGAKDSLLNLRATATLYLPYPSGVT